MTTDQLRLFLTIARRRSLARAAAELEIGQATVSERLKALETEVGTPLFERQGRGVVPTPAGVAFRPHAGRALKVLRQAKDSAHAASTGRGGQVSVAVTVRICKRITPQFVILSEAKNLCRRRRDPSLRSG
jgi:DNA-binding transcriptional LysR family regulator